ncbi:MAG: hypothetical protein ACYCZK_06535, partial [Microbacteriaceae bacterium]
AEPVESAAPPRETAPPTTGIPPISDPGYGAIAPPPSLSPALEIEPSPKPGHLPAAGPLTEPASQPSPEPAPVMEAAIEPARPRPGGTPWLSGEPLTGSSMAGGAAAASVPPRLDGEIAQGYTIDVVALTAIGSGLLLLGPVLVFGSRIKRRQPAGDQPEEPSPL